MTVSTVTEAQTSRASRPRRSVRIGVIHNGLNADDAFNARPDTTLLRSVRALPSSLLRYDVLVVLTHTDQSLLLHLKKPLTRYLRLGGVLVLLGATTQGCRWLPLCQWERTFTQSVLFDQKSADGQRIFKGISEPAYLKYHSAYVAHGSFVTHIALNDQVLAWDERERVIMFVRRLAGQGVLLATTLDPDYHASVPVPGPAEEPVETTHRKAAHLLDNILDWATWVAGETPRRRRRRLLGLVVPAAAVIAMVLLYALPVLLFVFLTFTSAGGKYAEPGGVVAGVAFLGSIASIYSVLLSIVVKKEQ